MKRASFYLYVVFRKSYFFCGGEGGGANFVLTDLIQVLLTVNFYLVYSVEF